MLSSSPKMRELRTPFRHWACAAALIAKMGRPTVTTQAYGTAEGVQ
ncbi:MAG: hypothetical protein HY862_02675 [Chloroflexi bacterium]|nr:hypothetical protein [Chloroflexota bacterium]